MKTVVIAMLENVSYSACPIAKANSGFVGPEVYTIQESHLGKLK